MVPARQAQYASSLTKATGLAKKGLPWVCGSLVGDLARGIALTRLVVLFDFAPFRVHRSKRGSRQRQITRSQIQDAFAAVSRCYEDLTRYQHREGTPSRKSVSGTSASKLTEERLVHCRASWPPAERATRRLLLRGGMQSFLVLLLMKTRFSAERTRHRPERSQRGSVCARSRRSLSRIDSFLVRGLCPFVLAGFLVGDPFGLLDQLEGNGQGGVLAQVQSRQQVDAFDSAVLCVVRSASR